MIIGWEYVGDNTVSECIPFGLLLKEITFTLKTIGLFISPVVQ
jgi:hypothetical protein